MTSSIHTGSGPEYGADSHPLPISRTRRRAPVRIAAAAVAALLALAGAAGTVMFGLLLAEPPLIGWSIVALAGHVAVLASLRGQVRGRRWAWTVCLCWATALAYWGLYKLLVEGEIESLAFTAAQVVLLTLLLVPAGRPAS